MSEHTTTDQTPTHHDHAEPHLHWTAAEVAAFPVGTTVTLSPGITARLDPAVAPTTEPRWVIFEDGRPGLRVHTIDAERVTGVTLPGDRKPPAHAADAATRAETAEPKLRPEPARDDAPEATEPVADPCEDGPRLTLADLLADPAETLAFGIAMLPAPVVAYALPLIDGLLDLLDPAPEPEPDPEPADTRRHAFTHDPGDRTCVVYDDAGAFTVTRDGTCQLDDPAETPEPDPLAERRVPPADLEDAAVTVRAAADALADTTGHAPVVRVMRALFDLADRLDAALAEPLPAAEPAPRQMAPGDHADFLSIRAGHLLDVLAGERDWTALSHAKDRLRRAVDDWLTDADRSNAAVSGTTGGADEPTDDEPDEPADPLDVPDPTTLARLLLRVATPACPPRVTHDGPTIAEHLARAFDGTLTAPFHIVRIAPMLGLVDVELDADHADAAPQDEPAGHPLEHRSLDDVAGDAITLDRIPLADTCADCPTPDYCVRQPGGCAARGEAMIARSPFARVPAVTPTMLGWTPDEVRERAENATPEPRPLVGRCGNLSDRHNKAPHPRTSLCLRWEPVQPALADNTLADPDLLAENATALLDADEPLPTDLSYGYAADPADVVRMPRLNGCSRCKGDGHDHLTFRPLTHPVREDGQIIGTHWTPCPTTGEPILLIERAEPEAPPVRGYCANPDPEHCNDRAWHPRTDDCVGWHAHPGGIGL